MFRLIGVVLMTQFTCPAQSYRLANLPSQPTRCARAVQDSFHVIRLSDLRRVCVRARHVLRSTLQMIGNSLGSQ